MANDITFLWKWTTVDCMFSAPINSDISIKAVLIDVEITVFYQPEAFSRLSNRLFCSIYICIGTFIRSIGFLEKEEVIQGKSCRQETFMNVSVIPSTETVLDNLKKIHQLE